MTDDVFSENFQIGRSSAARIETARLVLRPPVFNDGPGLHELLSDPEICRFSPYPPFATLADTHFAIVSWREARVTGLQTWVGASRSEPRTPIGFVQVGPDGEMGGMLSPARSGSGLAGEGIRAVIASLDLRNGWTVIDAEHHALIHTLERAGFVKESTLTRHRVHPQISSEPRDCVLLRQQMVV